MIYLYVAAGLTWLASTGDAFTSPSRFARILDSSPTKPTTATTLPASLIDNIMKPFQKASVTTEVTAMQAKEDTDDDNDFWVRQARLLVATDFGLLQPSLLDEDNFQWIEPSLDQALNKKEYLAATNFFDLRSTFPDLDYRAHDFRVVPDGRSLTTTVRLTCRTTGTMQKELRLRQETLPATGKTMICPPEAVTISFDNQTNKVVKLCTGFCMDRQVGNTGLATGVKAAAAIAGQRPSDLETMPLPVAIGKIFGRPLPKIPDTVSGVPPFAETVIAQLAKGIYAAGMGRDDPATLAQNFVYTTPYLGPIPKRQYLEKYAALEFADGTEPNFSNFRVDVYNPYRVWVDVAPTGPGYQGAPQAMSFSFDSDGYCTGITAGYVMDPTVGNDGGLGGLAGREYATQEGGAPRLGLFTRPLPRVLGRLGKLLTKPLTGVGVDDFTSMSDGVRLPKGSGDKKAATAAGKEAPPTKKSPFAAISKSSPIAKPAAAKKSVAKKAAPAKAKNAALGIAPPKKVAAKKAAPNKQAPAVIKKAPAVKTAPPKKVASMVKKTPPLAKKAPSAKKLAPGAKTTPKSPTLSIPTFEMPKIATSTTTRPVEKKMPAPKKAATPSFGATTFGIPNPSAQSTKTTIDAATAQQKRQEEARTKKQVAEAAKRERAEEAKRIRLAKQQAAVEKKEEAERLRLKKQQAIKQKKMEAERLRLEQRQAAEESKRQAQQAKQKQTETKQKKATAKAQRAERLKLENKAEEKQKKTEEAILVKLKNVASTVTIPLIAVTSGLSKTDDDDDLPSKPAPTTKTAPAGVPTMSRWRKNFDGSITGLISGSSNFANGERVTTSKIASGTIEGGEVVKTASGSRYFLE